MCCGKPLTVCWVLGFVALACAGNDQDGTSASGGEVSGGSGAGGTAGHTSDHAGQEAAGESGGDGSAGRAGSSAGGNGGGPSGDVAGAASDPEPDNGQGNDDDSGDDDSGDDDSGDDDSGDDDSGDDDSGDDDSGDDDSGDDDSGDDDGAVGCDVEPLELSGPGFECGDAHVFEDHGPPENRVNYVIVADGYTAAELDTALVEHVENMLYNPQTGMYSEIGEPYLRYRNFINVCAVRSASQESGVDGPQGNPDRDTIFDGRNCGDRLGCVEDRLVIDYLSSTLPDHVDADWVAATLNENQWWNSGGRLMVWSGKYMETNPEHAASVALHEAGHAFHQLADEYADDNLNCDCSAALEPNVACESDPGLTADDKWGEWFGFVMDGGGRLWNLGEHGAVDGGRYCGPTSGVTRPTVESEMNQLPYAHNMPSIQKAIHDIYAIVRPIDAHTPNDTPVANASALQVRLVDPEVLLVDWSVDGAVVEEGSGECFSLEGLSSGEHQVSARAYDDTPWVRDSRDDLEQTVQWTVLVP